MLSLLLLLLLLLLLHPHLWPQKRLLHLLLQPLHLQPLHLQHRKLLLHPLLHLCNHRNSSLQHNSNHNNQHFKFQGWRMWSFWRRRRWRR